MIVISSPISTGDGGLLLRVKMYNSMMFQVRRILSASDVTSPNILVAAPRVIVVCGRVSGNAYYHSSQVCTNGSS